MQIRDTILKQLDGIQNLPAMGNIASDVLRTLDNSSKDPTNISGIAPKIEKDIGLSAKIIKIANSTYYCSRYGEIGDVAQAIARLGFEEISRICLTVIGMQLFDSKSSLIDIKDFWRHSVGTATVMRMLIKESDQIPFFQHSYAVGLFHDIGIFVLDKYFPDIYRELLHLKTGKQLPLFELEQNILGIDHGEIGAVLLKKWHFPDSITSAIAFHHYPEHNADNHYFKLTQLIHLSDFACSALGYCEPGGTLPISCNNSVWHDLKINIENLHTIVEQIEENLTQSSVFVTMAL